MQFSRAILERIVAGDVTLAFRNWTRPTVKAGTRLRTMLGVVAIEAIEPASPEAVSSEDAAGAGFASVEALLADLRQGEGRGLYRIELRFDGPDGRVAAAGVAPTQEERRALLGEKLAFKADVRKLKELGLTESLDVGYRLSARGEAALAALEGG